MPHCATAQRVTGKWYGVGFVDAAEVTNNYLCELLIVQDGNTVTGEFNYYFRNGYFSNKIKGTFTTDSRYLYLSLLPVMYNHTVNTLIGVDCPMHGEFTLKVARAGATIAGNFVSDDLHKYTCAPLKVTFKKMLDTDPTLKERLEHPAKEDSTEENIVEMPATDTPKNVAAAPPAKIDTPKAIVSAPVKIDTPKTTVAAPPAITPTAPVAAPVNIAAEAEKKVTLRATVPEKVLEVTDDSVRVELYDNGVLDYDTVSVFFNKKLVEYNKLLQTREPLRFYVHVTEDEAGNELVMYAENLGLIPPNSAVMIITDSSHRYEVSLTSDYQKNASVRLRRAQKPVTQ